MSALNSILNPYPSYPSYPSYPLHASLSFYESKFNELPFDLIGLVFEQLPIDKVWLFTLSDKPTFQFHAWKKLFSILFVGCLNYPEISDNYLLLETSDLHLFAMQFINYTKHFKWTVDLLSRLSKREQRQEKAALAAKQRGVPPPFVAPITDLETLYAFEYAKTVNARIIADLQLVSTILQQKRNLKTFGFQFLKNQTTQENNTDFISGSEILLDNLFSSILDSNRYSLRFFRADLLDLPLEEDNVSFIRFINVCSSLKIIEIILPSKKFNADPLGLFKQKFGIQYTNSLQRLKIFNSLDISPVLYKFPNLKSLFLLDCHIFHLFNFDPLVHLRELLVAHNYIYEIPSLFELPYLKKLDLQYNNLCEIPELKGLPQLEELNFSHNYISSILDLSSLKKLKQIKADFNIIESLEPFQNLTTLNLLHVSNNKISDISPIANLIGIKTLELSCNKIKEANIFNGFKELEYLLLSDNEITLFNITDETNLKLLRTIDLENNLLTSLHNVDKLVNLCILTVTNNKLTEITDDILKLKKLTSISVNRNQITKCCVIKSGTLNKLDDFDLDNNLLEEFIVETNSLQGIYSLSLNYNKIKKIDFIKCAAIDGVDADTNSDTDDNDSDNDNDSDSDSDTDNEDKPTFLPRIRHLGLSNNQIESMSWLKDVCINSQYTIINLSANCIKILEKLNNLKNVGAIHLLNNLITNMADSAFYSQIKRR